MQANHAGHGRATNRGSGAGGGRGAGGLKGGGRRFECPPGGEAADKQASFASPFPEDPVTAIVGGGLSGLVCALELARAGLRSVVFDTGEHGVGGRLATRTSADGSLAGAPPGLVFDHAAQYFTAADPAFRAMVAGWERDGVVERWEGPVGSLHDGAFTPDSSQGERFIARGGMRRLAGYLAGQASQALQAHGGAAGGGRRMEGLVEVRRPQWVSSARHTEDGWQLVGRGREQGLFDACIIAHNGKCANRLAGPMGAPAVYSQLRRLKLSANWVLLAAFASPVPVPGGVEGAVVQGSKVLSWAANNTKKLRLGGPAECWTLISTQNYGKQNKVPQENVPPEAAERVARDMLAAFERALGLPQGGLPPVTFTKTQLWGAALPLNSPNVPCIWDPVGRVGVCGDWVAGGGSVEAAALSGQALAQQIDATRGRQAADLAGLAMGLTTPLTVVAGEDFGVFPSAAARQQQQQRQEQQQEQQPKQQPKQRQTEAPSRPAWKRSDEAEAAAATQLLARPVRRGGD